MTDKEEARGVVEAAFRRYHGEVYRYLLRRTHNHHDAEELAQRVFADAAASLARTQPRSTLAWLYSVAERRFIDEVRRRERIAQAAALVSAASAVELDYGPQTVRALRQAIERLDYGRQRVVVMKLFEGRPFAEIAARLQISEPACKMRFSRAVRELRAWLEAEGLKP